MPRARAPGGPACEARGLPSCGRARPHHSPQPSPPHPQLPRRAAGSMAALGVWSGEQAAASRGPRAVSTHPRSPRGQSPQPPPCPLRGLPAQPLRPPGPRPGCPARGGRLLGTFFPSSIAAARDDSSPTPFPSSFLLALGLPLRVSDAGACGVGRWLCPPELRSMAQRVADPTILPVSSPLSAALCPHPS